MTLTPEKIRERLTCHVEHLEGEHADKCVVKTEVFNALYDYAAKLAEVMEGMPDEIKDFNEWGELQAGEARGFNDCRQQILELINPPTKGN